jgi:drug/metabolite transporter (DMT)-like permease
VGKLIGDAISPYAITAWRFLTGGLVLLPFAIRERKSGTLNLSVKSFLSFLTAGILNVCISMLLLQLSVFYGKGVLSAIIVSTNPLFVVLMAFLFLKEKITRLHLMGLLLGLIGLFLIIYGEKAALMQSQNLVLGVLFGLAAAFTFGIYTVYTKHLILKYGNLTTLSLTFITGSLSLFVISAVAGKQLLFVLKPVSLAYLMYLSIFVTGIAYILYFKSISAIGAANSSMLFFLKPAVAAILAWSLKNESLNTLQLIGIVIIMISIGRDAVMQLVYRIKVSLN